MKFLPLIFAKEKNIVANKKLRMTKTTLIVFKKSSVLTIMTLWTAPTTTIVLGTNSVRMTPQICTSIALSIQIVRLTNIRMDWMTMSFNYVLRTNTVPMKNHMIFITVWLQRDVDLKSIRNQLTNKTFISIV